MLWMMPALALDLQTTRERATQHAIEVDRAEARRRSAQGAVWVAASGSLPSISLFGSASTGAGLTSFGFERPVSTQLGVGVTGSWTLLDPGGWAAADAARHSARGSRALLDWARVQARQQATSAVAQLWVSQQEQTAWEAAATDAEKAVEGVSSLVQTGLRPPADLARSQATAATLRANAIRARGESEAACAALQSLLRDPITGTCTLDTPALDLPKKAAGEHPALVAAKEALSAARAARTGALLDRAPTVTASGTAGQYIAGDNAGLGWSAGLDASLPVLSGGAGHGSNRIAAAERDDAALALEAATLDLASATVAAAARFRAAESGLEALEAADKASTQALDLTAARYSEGLEGLEAWLSARRARDEARVALARGRGERLQALAQLEGVRGVR